MAPLAVIRKQKPMTQRELAEAAGVTLATVHYAETGATKPTIRVTRAICEVLGVRPQHVDEFRAALNLPEPA